MGKGLLIISSHIFYEEVNILFNIVFPGGVKYKIRKNKTKRLSNEINAMKTCTTVDSKYILGHFSSRLWSHTLWHSTGNSCVKSSADSLADMWTGVRTGICLWK